MTRHGETRPHRTDQWLEAFRPQLSKGRIIDPLYGLYARRLRRQIKAGPLPEHVGLIMDGNRRWARQMGMADLSLGHKYGAEHVEDVLSWCETVGIKHITVFVCSTENLQRRGDAEVTFLMQVIEQVLANQLAMPDTRWQVHIAGTLDVLPDATARALKDAVEATRTCATGAHVTLAVGYGGREEVIEAMRELLYERAAVGESLADLASTLTVDDITQHLYTAGRPDPDLVIRTSGEQRMSNFLLWQSAYSELYFCEAYWPAFREIDFLRALRSFAARERRYGG
jgi:short-chain Z-isoprenyl diphosphate synthase